MQHLSMPDDGRWTCGMWQQPNTYELWAASVTAENPPRACKRGVKCYYMCCSGRRMWHNQYYSNPCASYRVLNPVRARVLYYYHYFRTAAAPTTTQDKEHKLYTWWLINALAAIRVFTASCPYRKFSVRTSCTLLCNMTTILINYID